MRKIIYPIVFLVAFGCGKKSESTESVSGVEELIVSETISDAEFQQKMASLSEAVVLDVRTPEEFANGYIEGAVNIDFRSSDFESKISQLDRETTYLVYCGSGIRSRKAADLMKDLKFKKVYDMDGGLSAWAGDGLPVKTN